MYLYITLTPFDHTNWPPDMAVPHKFFLFWTHPAHVQYFLEQFWSPLFNFCKKLPIIQKNYSRIFGPGLTVTDWLVQNLLSREYYRFPLTLYKPHPPTETLTCHWLRQVNTYLSEGTYPLLHRTRLCGKREPAHGHLVPQVCHELVGLGLGMTWNGTEVGYAHDL